MQTISDEEFKKRYGTQGYSALKQTHSSFSERLKQGFNAGISQIKSASGDINSGNPIRFAEGALKAGAGVVNTAFSPISAAIEPVIKPTLGAGVNYAADKLSNNPTVQKFANAKIGELTSRITEDLNNLNTIASAVVGSKGVGNAVSKLDGIIGDIKGAIPQAGNAIQTASPMIGAAKTAISEVSPTYGSIINDQVTKAFDLTAGDIKNITKSTGNSVGDFVSKNNLIGNTVDASKSLLSDFYKQNYNTVRSEIGKVVTEYKASSVPRYTEALTELQKKVTDVPGLQKTSAEVNSLLAKKTINLSDVQRAKELMDAHFNLYKVTGDVGEGIAKEGLANIRKDLRGFVEQQVKAHTGTDIAELNNNVATSQSIIQAITERSGRASTRQKISLGDLGWFSGGSIVGTPLFGIAAVFAKKVIESPSVRLRIAKFIKGLDDAKQLKIKADLKAGKIPTELNQFLKSKSKLNDLKDGINSSNVGLSTTNPKILELRMTAQRLRQRKVALLTQGFKETHPAVKKLISQLQSIDEQVAQLNKNSTSKKAGRAIGTVALGGAAYYGSKK